MRYKVVATIVLATLVVIFVLQNTEVVEVRFLLWGFDVPRAPMIFAVLIIGVVLGWLWRGRARRG
ncbi:MAG: LapA family protein [Gammaproteobacteria bacterium]|nr:LapA family protein [Gammaproteobacteria bacterium]